MYNKIKHMVIYETINLINGKKYIGKDRKNSPTYIGGGVDLKKDIEFFGKENFKKEILEYCTDLIHLKDREEYWLNKVDAKNNPLYYNKTNKSFGSDNGPTKTEKYLNRGPKIREARIGKKCPNISKALKGKKNPINSEKLKGKKKTKEHCENLSKSKMGIPSKRKGKPDLKQKGKPKPGAGGKGVPHIGAGPKTGNGIINKETGETYKSIKECMDLNNISKRWMFTLLKDPDSKFGYLNKNYWKK